MVINGYGLLWYFFTLLAGASFAIIYMQIKGITAALKDYDDLIEDEEDYDTSLVTVGGKYYEVPEEVATAITNMNRCAEMLATDLAKTKKKDAIELFHDYFMKARDEVEKCHSEE